jgi:hypothetical protein
MRLLPWILLPAFLTSSLAATPAVKKAPAKKAVAAPAGKSAHSSKTKSAGARRSKSAPRPMVSSRQQTPSPDRYKEIQQALAEKGYLKSEATGVWNAESSDALRQFQTEHNLSPTGKLSAASLIGLGLGPKPSTDPIVPPVVQKAESRP